MVDYLSVIDLGNETIDKGGTIIPPGNYSSLLPFLVTLQLSVQTCVSVSLTSLQRKESSISSFTSCPASYCVIFFFFFFPLAFKVLGLRSVTVYRSLCVQITLHKVHLLKWKILH